MRRRVHPILIVFACLAISSSAQARETCHAENDGNTYNPQIKVGPNELTVAVRFVSPKTFTCVGSELFTGDKAGTHKVSLRPHDANADAPKPVALASTSWNEPGGPVDWRGNLFTTPASLTAGTIYWIVWTAPVGSQASVESHVAAGQQYRLSSNNGATWGNLKKDGDHHWKFRLEGLDDCCPGLGTFDTFGNPCPGTPNKSPQWDDVTGCATPGGQFVLEASALSNTPALLLIGGGNNSAAIVPGCSLLILPLYPVTATFNVPSNGQILLPASIPPTTPTPLDIYTQILVADPGAAYGVASTRGMEIHIE